MSRTHRILYNNDGTFILGNDIHGRRPLTRSDVRDYVDLMAGTPVTTYLQCTNSLMPYHPSRHERFVGQAEGSKYPAGEQTPMGLTKEPLEAYGRNIRTLAAQGTDIVSLIVERCREKGLEVFTSERVNDLHFNNRQIICSLGQAEFWLDHPEYTIGPSSMTDWNCDGAFNFEHAAVRDYKLALLRERMDRFRPDGHEMDLMRFPVYFPPDRAAACCPIMTDYLRQCRAIVKSTPRPDGKPPVFGVRIPASVGLCKGIGLDPQAWVKEGLVDFMTLSAFFTDVPHIPLAKFRRDIDSPDIPLYAALDHGVAEPKGCWGMFRACAASRWQEGADGLYFFNFFYHTLEWNNHFGIPSAPTHTETSRMGPSRTLLAELADPGKLSGRNKIYNSGRSWGQAYRAEERFDLPDESKGGVLEFRLFMAREATPPRETLLFLRTMKGGPELRVTLNGAACPPCRADASRYGLDVGQETDPAHGPDQIFAYAVDPTLVRDGENCVRVENPVARQAVFFVRRADCVMSHGPVETHGYF